MHVCTFKYVSIMGVCMCMCVCVCGEGGGGGRYMYLYIHTVYCAFGWYTAYVHRKN